MKPKLFSFIKVRVNGLFVALSVALFSQAYAQQTTPKLGQEQLQGNEDALAKKMLMLIQDVSTQQNPTGTIKRLNQAKSLGCFDGYFEVQEDIPESFKHGLFAKPGRYSAFTRFANASTFDDSEKDLRGMSIKVRHNDQSATLWGNHAEQDFLLNSYPVLFAESPEVFQQFIQAQKDDSILGFFLNPFDSHLKALSILLNARERPNSPFDIRFWSTTAYRLGNENQAVKYSVKPCSDYQSPEPEEFTENYLQKAMQRHLDQDKVCFEFMLQRQVDPIAMQIEDATVEWDEAVSPFITVAKLTIEKQDFLSDEKLDLCETSTFNPWQALEVHKPLGRINFVRKLIYEKMAAFRQSGLNVGTND